MSEILFADDDEALRGMVTDLLEAAGHRVRAVASGAEALAEIRRLPPELAVLDYRMGRPDGLEVTRSLKDDPRFEHLPVLILTGEGQIENRLRGFEAGAEDYIAKPFDPRELVARVTALLRLARRGLDRNPTTRLPGGDAIREEIARRDRGGRPFAICYLDLDHFKPFSDRFGFTVADAAIREVGAAVGAIGDEERVFVGHVGGDDFVVLCDAAEARRLVREVQQRFSTAIMRHLPADVLRKGTYRAEDRYGVWRDFPMTRLSAAIVRIDPARGAPLDRLGEVVAGVKRDAKREAEHGIAELVLEG